MKKFYLSAVFLLFVLTFFMTSCQIYVETSGADETLEDESVLSVSSDELESVEPTSESESVDFSEDVSIHEAHVFSDWETKKEASCKEAGLVERVCTVCGFSESDETEILPHTQETLPAKDPTCTEHGLTEGNFCTVCAFIITEQEVISPTGHNYVEKEKVEPTCQKDGYTLFSCACGETYTGEATPKLPHNYTEKIIEPTCKNDGYTLHKCTACSDSYKDNYTKKGHEYVQTVISPTCKTEGYTLHKCSSCGDSYKDNKVDKTKHSYTSAVILPTLLDQGYTRYTCSYCKTSYKDNYTDYSSICSSAYAGNKKVLAQGIDVSKWNHKKDADGNFIPLDWVAIKNAGIDYVIIKAGSNVGIDPTFDMNYEGAKAAGLDVGAYYYSYALNVNDAIEEAKQFVTYVKGKTFEYPLYMDFEDSSQRSIAPSVKTEMIKSFAATLQRNGYYAGLYVGKHWMTPEYKVLEADKLIGMIDIWFARIDSSESVSIDQTYTWNPEDCLGHEEFGMWQYAHKGVFSFIEDEHFDLNYAYKDYPSIIKKLGLNGFSGESKEYVWVIVRNLNVRSYWDLSTANNVLTVAHFGDKFEIIEKTDEYVKIKFEGTEAYVSANPAHVSFTEPTS
ncbi:MAG: hypothetical protein E7614_03810 [Ruminococcaceae bacterium]|nr:hypothetical protein [Oscillospiraceae bacterium]